MRVPNTVHSEKELRDTLDLIYAQSKAGKSFTGILELVTNEQTVRTAIHNIKSNQGSNTPGIDGKTINDYLMAEGPESLDKFVDYLGARIKNYKPKPVRRVYIPKANGKQRPLGIPCMIDRIIQECFRIVLEPIVEGRFYKHSYGFRPYRAASHAVARVTSLLNEFQGCNSWTIEGDIKGYFDNVDHRIMLEKLRRIGVIDKRVIEVIRRMLTAGVYEKGHIKRSDKGTPQGGVLSPLLANVYLNDFDWWIARKYAEPKEWEKRCTSLAAQQIKLKHSGRKAVHLTRYADDWVIQCPDERTAECVLADCEKYFKHRLKLELSPEKTVITDAKVSPLNFLGILIRAVKKRPTPGQQVTGIVGKTEIDGTKLRAAVKSWTRDLKQLRQGSRPEDLAILLEQLNAKIAGWAEYHKMASASADFALIDHLLYLPGKKAVQRVFDTKQVDTYRRRLDMLDNRTGRHKGYTFLTWAVPIEGNWIGLTRAACTSIVYPRKKHPEETPYSESGRLRYYLRTGKVRSLDRPPLYDIATLAKSVGTERLYTLEYMLNREKALNQTIRKGQFTCQVCGAELVESRRHCHHRRLDLPAELINKVRNLIWLCIDCHEAVEHIDKDISCMAMKPRLKIEQLRGEKQGILTSTQDNGSKPVKRRLQRSK